MQQMYEDFQDVAEFRMVYINEAHAADSSWPVPYAKEKGIVEHQNYGQRCSVAEKMFQEKKLTIPCVVDDMEDTTNKAYHAWPDRVFVVRKDGRLVVAAKRGPWGFKPAVKQAQTWLASYKETGVEPEAMPPEESSAEGSGKPGPRLSAAEFGQLLGEWEMKSDLGGNVIPATMVLTAEKGHLQGVWKSQGREMTLEDLAYADGELTFKRSIGPGDPLAYQGTIKGEEITGQYDGPFGQISSNGKRTKRGEVPVAESKMTPQQRMNKIQELTQQLMQTASQPGGQVKGLELALLAVEQADALQQEFGGQAAQAVSLTHYNAACMYSRMNKKDEAFEHLNRSLNAGSLGTDYVQQMENDSDLDNIRKDPRYQEALAKARKIDGL